MRITFVAPFGLSSKGTVRARTLPLARMLAERGHPVTLLIPPWDAPAEGGRSWEENGLRVVSVSVQGGLPWILARLWRGLGRSQPDIVHIVKPRAYAGLVQWLLWQRRRWRGRGVRIVLDVDDWEQAWEEVAGYPWLLARFLAWQEEWGIRHADAVTAASHWLADRVRADAPGTPVLYLPNGVPGLQEGEPLPEGPAPEPGTATVLWFTRFVEVAPSWMAAFWQALQRLQPGVHLLVAGQALQPGRAERFREALAGVTVQEGALEWVGPVAPDALPSLYARSTCAVFPAADVPLNQAKCSVRLATTLLQGVPVVASGVGEQVHYGQAGAARLVPPEATPEEFAQAVAALLDAPGQRQQLRERARARLHARYGWERLAGELEAFYRQLAERG